MKALFTKFDTVSFEDGSEMSLPDYYENLENGISQGILKDFSYNPNNKQLSYTHNGELYVCQIDDASYNSEKIRGLIAYDLIRNKLEADMHDEENRKKKQINDAYNGVVETEEAKKIYIKDLKKKRWKTIFKQLKFVKTISYDKIAEVLHVIIGIAFSVDFIFVATIFDSIGVSRLITILSSLLCFVIGVSGIHANIYDNYNNLANPATLVAHLITFIFQITFGIVPSIIKSISNLIKIALPEIKTINHRIKYIENYKIDSKKESTKIDEISNDKSLETSINNVYRALNNLDKETQQRYIMLISKKLSEYRERLALVDVNSVSRKGYEEDLRLEIVDYFNGLVADINSLLSDNDNSLDDTLSKMQNDLDSGDFAKGKVLVRIPKKSSS